MEVESNRAAKKGKKGFSKVEKTIKIATKWASHIFPLKKYKLTTPEYIITFLFAKQDADYRSMASALNERWKELGRVIRPELEGSDSTSLIYLERPFVVPGGRFREVRGP